MIFDMKKMSHLSIIFNVMLLFACKMLTYIINYRHYGFTKKVSIKSLRVSLSCYS